VWNAFTAVQLIEAFLNRRQKLNVVSDLVDRAIVRQLANGLKHHFLFRHKKNYAATAPNKASGFEPSPHPAKKELMQWSQNCEAGYWLL
jgi:hypothetical protein